MKCLPWSLALILTTVTAAYAAPTQTVIYTDSMLPDQGILTQQVELENAEETTYSCSQLNFRLILKTLQDQNQAFQRKNQWDNHQHASDMYDYDLVLPSADGQSVQTTNSRYTNETEQKISEAERDFLINRYWFFTQNCAERLKP